MWEFDFIDELLMVMRGEAPEKWVENDFTTRDLIAIRKVFEERHRKGRSPTIVVDDISPIIRYLDESLVKHIPRVLDSHIAKEGSLQVLLPMLRLIMGPEDGSYYYVERVQSNHIYVNLSYSTTYQDYARFVYDGPNDPALFRAAIVEAFQKELTDLLPTTFIINHPILGLLDQEPESEQLILFNTKQDNRFRLGWSHPSGIVLTGISHNKAYSDYKPNFRNHYPTLDLRNWQYL